MTLMRYKPLGHSPADPRLGRFIPDDWEHVEKYPFSALLATTTQTVEKRLRLPFWHRTHDQGSEGSCVGHGAAMERAITNSAQMRLAALTRYWTRRYDPLHLWNEAKKIDSWPDTNPGDNNGTSVRAAYDVLRTQGARRIGNKGIFTQYGGKTPTVSDTKNPPDPEEGVSANRWASTIDEMRTAISMGNPVVIGINWYANFDRPQQKINKEFWVGEGDLGRIRGGHCVCLYGASDRRQAFAMKNSWGSSYPLVWLPYAAMERTLREYGEATLQTDR